METTSLPRIPEIEGLRAIAIVLVVLYHFDLPVPGGFFGVDLFFAVSGFVIARQLLHSTNVPSTRRPASLVALGNFYRRRALRLLPNAIALCGFVVLGSCFWPSIFGDSGRTLKNAVAGIAGVGNWYAIQFPDRGVGEVRPLIHMWSLSIEEQFYLALPLAVLPWRRARLGATLFGTGAVLISIASAAAKVGTQAALFSTWSRISPIGMGVIVAVILDAWRGRREAVPLEGLSWTSRLFALRNIALPVLLGLLGLLSLSTHWNDTWLPRGGYVAVGTLCGAIVMLCASGVGSPLGSALRSRAGRLVASRSYAIYLWHFPVAFMFVGLSRGPQLLFRVLLTGLLAEVSTRFIEQPFRNTKRIATACYAPIAMAGASLSLLLYWRLNHA